MGFFAALQSICLFFVKICTGGFPVDLGECDPNYRSQQSKCDPGLFLYISFVNRIQFINIFWFMLVQFLCVVKPKLLKNALIPNSILILMIFINWCFSFLFKKRSVIIGLEGDELFMLGTFSFALNVLMYYRVGKNWDRVIIYYAEVGGYDYDGLDQMKKKFNCDFHSLVAGMLSSKTRIITRNFYDKVYDPETPSLAYITLRIGTLAEFNELKQDLTNTGKIKNKDVFRIKYTQRQEFNHFSPSSNGSQYKPPDILLLS